MGIGKKEVNDAVIFYTYGLDGRDNGGEKLLVEDSIENLFLWRIKQLTCRNCDVMIDIREKEKAERLIVIPNFVEEEEKEEEEEPVQD